MDPLVTNPSGVRCKQTSVLRLVVNFHSLYRCSFVRQTPYDCSPVVDDSVLIVERVMGVDRQQQLR